MIRFTTILIMALLGGINALQAQITLTYTITAEGETVPFAHVDLFAPADSTKAVAQGITDFNGAYSIGNLKPGRYTIEVSYVGYETLREPLRLACPQPVRP